MNTKIPGRTHYTLLSGALVRVPVLDDAGDEIATEVHMLKENICIYVEGQDTISTERGITLRKHD